MNTLIYSGILVVVMTTVYTSAQSNTYYHCMMICTELFDACMTQCKGPDDCVTCSLESGKCKGKCNSGKRKRENHDIRYFLSQRNNSY